MNWPITFRGERPKDAQPGDAYFVQPEYVKEREDGVTVACGHALSSGYDAVKAQRRPIAIVLPTGYTLLVDTAFWGPSNPNSSREGWVVSIVGVPTIGEQLRITLSPSVNIVGSYHGWIRDGVISPDVEGRAFP
jgi:hypothetical protein